MPAAYKVPAPGPAPAPNWRDRDVPPSVRRPWTVLAADLDEDADPRAWQQLTPASMAAYEEVSMLEFAAWACFKRNHGEELGIRESLHVQLVRRVETPKRERLGSPMAPRKL